MMTADQLIHIVEQRNLQFQYYSNRVLISGRANLIDAELLAARDEHEPDLLIRRAMDGHQDASFVSTSAPATMTKEHAAATARMSPLEAARYYSKQSLWLQAARRAFLIEDDEAREKAIAYIGGKDGTAVEEARDWASKQQSVPAAWLHSKPSTARPDAVAPSAVVVAQPRQQDEPKRDSKHVAPYSPPAVALVAEAVAVATDMFADDASIQQHSRFKMIDGRY